MLYTLPISIYTDTDASKMDRYLPIPILQLITTIDENLERQNAIIVFEITKNNPSFMY